jgi:cellulose synthase/poly-beta-1,6-N-acetylglucosamine synthase-like glycosyltransferase
MTVFVDGTVAEVAVQTRAAGLRENMFEPVFQGTSRIIYAAGIAAWAAAMLYFWAWWLQPEHIIDLPYFLLLTATVGWVTIIPAYFILIFFNARRMRTDRQVALPGRIAMVVTKAPSEPFAVVRRTLLAMLDQIGAEFDVWLADEDPALETIDWCTRHGIRISTRKGVSDYHQTSWPRRTRCKEGNLAYFYDHYGYERYDFVAQFDADHVPEPTYLREIIKPFQDPRIGYVSAPSICDANAETSWSARGRLYAEASLHGALQVGYNSGWAPLCIGSHYAVRTAALKQIGGLGPELAEDHSTTLLMNAGGWKGAHAVDAIAHGDGPATFADLIVQEFQWSRSLVTILLQYSRRYVPRLSPRLQFQFLFSQLWYPLFSAFMALMFALPLVGLLAGRSFVNVNYPDFVLHFLPLSMVLIGLAFFWRASKMFRPHNAKIFGWEGILFVFLRWPWSLAGSVAALRDHLTGSFVDFRITPKGQQTARRLPQRVLAPYLLLAALSVAAMASVGSRATTPGFALFAGLNAVIYATVVVLVSWRHARENRLPCLPRSSAALMTTVAIGLILIGVGREVGQNGARGVEALSHGLKIISLTEAKFAVAGAGQGGAKTRIVRFRWKWNGFADTAAVRVDRLNV